MSTYKITWLHDLYKKAFRKPKLSYNRERVNIAPKGSKNKALEGSETIVSGTHLRRIANQPPSTELVPPNDVNPKSIFKSIQFKPYSVIGETGKIFSLTKKGQFNYQTPDYVDIDFSKTALVDAGGLPYFIKNSAPIDPTAQKKSTGPQGAGFSSGALYEFIGIDKDPNFPDDVTGKITGIGDATFYQYKRGVNTFNVIHAIGPDFRLTPDTLKETISKNEDFKDIKTSANIDKPTAINILSLLYKNIFIEFIKNKNTYNLNTLNIVPISIGQFAGKVLQNGDEKANVTMTSIFNALGFLNPEQLNELKGIKILLCIWKGTDDITRFYERSKNISLTSMGGHFKLRSVKQKKKNKKRTFRKYFKKNR